MKITENIKKELERKQDFYVLKLPEEVINFFKSGGNLKITAKKGSKIHIKKKNRGKFTDYCGGSVTSECIAKGKRSPNPTIRKRATFADNARHFKHRLGGSIVEAFKLRKQILNSLLQQGDYFKWKNTIVRVKKKGGSMRIPGVIDSNPNLDNMKGNYVSKKKPLKIKKYGK